MNIPAEMRSANELVEKKRFVEARQIYQAVLKQMPEYATALYGRALTYLEQPTFALADLDQAIAADPRYIEAYVKRGRVYHLRGDYQNAAKDFTSAISLHPEYAVAYYYRGLSYCQLKLFPQAQADYVCALRMLDITPDTALKEKVQQAVTQLPPVASAPPFEEEETPQSTRCSITLGM